ncbi:MAG: hypothetical protein AAFQ74_07300 [Cyanobacteria bacterium J06623_4]
METIAFATLANTNLVYTSINDAFVLVTRDDQPACLKIGRMQAGTVTGNTSQRSFAIELIQSPQVQAGLNSPAVRRL